MTLGVSRTGLRLAVAAAILALTAAGCGGGGGGAVTTGMTPKAVRATAGRPLRVVRGNPRNPDCWLLRNRRSVCFRHGRVDYYGP
jgi:hypothetical protein